MSLIFNIPAYNLSGDFVTYTPNKISIAPELPNPELFPQFGKFLKYLSGRHTLQYLRYLRRGISGWCLNKYVHMVFHDFHRIYPEFILFSYPLKYLLQVPRYLLVQYMLPVLRYPYQVIFQTIYGVSCPSYSHTTVIQAKVLFRQAPLPRPTASHFPPASKLAGIQWSSL